MFERIYNWGKSALSALSALSVSSVALVSIVSSVESITKVIYDFILDPEKTLKDLALERKPYIDGTPTPLYRGFLMTIFGILCMFYLLWNYHCLNRNQIIVLIGYISNCIASFFYHNVYAPQLERIISAIDHIAISFVILTNSIPFYDGNYLLHFVPFIMVASMDSIMLFINPDHANQLMHHIIQGFLSLITFIYIIYVSWTGFLDKKLLHLFLTSLFYIGGQIKWLTDKKVDKNIGGSKKENTPGDPVESTSYPIAPWGYHENFHLAVIAGHILMYNLIGGKHPKICH